MADGIIGALLAQTQPASTAAVTAYTASLLTEITRIVIANTAPTACTFRIHHNDTAATYTAVNALYYDIAIAANTTYTVEAANQGTGFFVSKAGTIGVQCALTGSCTFSIYGRTREAR